MPGFFDITDVKSLEDYLAKIKPPIKKDMISKKFQGALQLLNRIRSQYRMENLPEIRIRITDEIKAESNEFAIYINEGLINQCLLTCYPSIQDIIENPEGNVLFPTYLFHFDSLLCWTLAHEYVHVVREHNSVIEHAGKDANTQLAIERDADLCAVAYMYRWLQDALWLYFDDAQIKQLLLLGVFSAIRSLPEPETNRSHPSTANRLFDIALKIATLRRDPSDPPDPSAETEESKTSATLIFECLAKCELAYQKLPDSLPNNLALELLDFIEKKGWRTTIRRWEEIRTIVAEKSGTLA